MPDAYPKISIVTPAFNDVEHIESTIRSLIDQEYPNLEYIIIDGGSTDGTVDVIKKYSHKLSYWVSERDQGMYHALDKGFRLSTGELMGWLNADDIHHTRSLFTIAEIFSLSGEINWIQGTPNAIDEMGRIVFASPRSIDKYYFYRKEHLRTRQYIQQESTFWRRELWRKAGGYISLDYRYAGDFELWIRFFQWDQLQSVPGLLGSFRMCSSGQASVEHYNDYMKETLQILEAYPLNGIERRQLANELSREKLLKRLSRLFGLNSAPSKLPVTFLEKIKYDSVAQRYKFK